MIWRRYIGFLLALLLGGCAPPRDEVSIAFAPLFGQTPIGCEARGESPYLTDLRLYISNVRLIGSDGVAADVRLIEDQRWQRPMLALLDFETGTSGCINGTPATNTTLRGLVPQGDYRGLQFTVGVPFEHNHGDPLLASAPLGDAAMHWHWRGGYKFLRAGVATANDGFWLHLGSTGCEGTVQNITGCRAPNRIEVTLEEFVLGRDSVAIDIAALTAGVDLADGVAGDCASGPGNKACVAPFAALGLDIEAPGEMGAQNVFRREAGP